MIHLKINYPNGQPSFQRPNNRQPQTPISLNSKGTFANRGMSFEEEINKSNHYYLTKGRAVIHKKPTPIQIVDVHYPKRSAAVIKEAYFKEASTTDYNGIYNGFYIDFEAKATKNKTSFPLANFHQHQIDHMEHCLEQGGIIFVLIWFSTLKECYLFPAKPLIDYWKQKETNRKSIPINCIRQDGFDVPLGFAPSIPYLDALDQYILEGDHLK